MTWKIRHEGSPRTIDGLNLPQIVQGLQDGQWEGTDEVMGPEDTRWTSIEAHPELADAAYDVEPPLRKSYDDETRLDMTALIDVCLVLLVFFILATSYAALQKMLDMPGISADGIKGPPKITKEQIDQLMIRVDMRMDGEKLLIKVEGQEVERENVGSVLAKYVSDTKKTELLIDHSPNVPHGMVIAVEDAARGAGIREARILIPREELPR